MTREELEKIVHEFTVQIYKEGFEEGREDAEMDTKTRVKEAYAKGLEDTWECARQIHGMHCQKLSEVFPDSTHDNIFIDYSASEAMQKIKEYEERQKQTDATDIDDGSIKVGDEVRIKGSDPVKNDCDYGVCTWISPLGTMYVMRRDGSSGEEKKDEWYRTGKHFKQIEELLKLLRGEK